MALTGGQTLSDLLPFLLARWTGVGDATSWAARLQYWLEDDNRRPLILVVADGLSERTDVAWPNFFRPVGQSAWRSSAADDLSREDWIGLLIDREATARDSKRLQRRLSQARLRQNAVIEDADLRTPRGLDRGLFQSSPPAAGCVTASIC